MGRNMSYSWMQHDRNRDNLMPRQLTVKQQRFRDAYCANGGNGTQAAIDAGYSEAVAKEIAYENLTKPHIKAAIDEFRAQNAAKADITVQSITKELQQIAQKATESGQHSAAVSAQLGVAKLHGLLTEDRRNARDPLTDAMARVAKRERQESVH